MATATKEKLEPIAPGEILKEEFMDPLKLNTNQLALALRVSATRMSEIIHGQRKITPETALRLSQFFGTTPKFWLNLQCSYDLQIAEEEVGPRVEREVEPLKPCYAPDLCMAAEGSERD